MPNSRAIELGALVAFSVAVAVGLHQHSMWFDETQSWAIARSSHNLSDLFHNLAYEGHPPLWHLVLFGLTRVTTDVRAMQVVTWVIATTTAALLLWRAPWNHAVRIAICFGYFVGFEYSVLSRSYALTLLLVVVALVLRPASWSWTLALALLCFTSVLGVILAATLAVVELTRSRRPRAVAVWAAAVTACAGLLAIWSALPPDDSRSGRGFGEALAGSFDARAGLSLSAVARALIPIPTWPVRWNSTAIQGLSLTVSAIVGIVLLIGVAVAFRGSRRALTTWVFGVGALLVFFTTVYPPHNLRHSGHVALVLLAAAWYWRADRSPESPPARATTGLLVALLAASLLAGVVTSVVFLDRPFSSAAHTAARIRALGPGIRLVSLADLYGTNVGAYLDRPVYSAATGKPIRFVRYDERTLFFTHSPSAAILRNARTFVDTAPHGAVVIADGRHHRLLAQLPGRWITPDARLVDPSAP